MCICLSLSTFTPVKFSLAPFGLPISFNAPLTFLANLLTQFGFHSNVWLILVDNSGVSFCSTIEENFLSKCIAIVVLAKSDSPR